MIKAKNYQLVENAFCGHVPYFGCRDTDAYTGDVTLYDEEEMNDEITTTLWIMDEGDYCVSVDRNVDGIGEICTEEQFDDFTDAWHAYERQKKEEGIEEHDEPEPEVDELLAKCVEIVARKYELYRDFSIDGNVSMAGTYLTAYQHCLMMTEEITGVSSNEINVLIDKELEKCSRTPF